MKTAQPTRILVIDDTPAIHDDLRRILQPASHFSELKEMEADLFDDEAERPEGAFEVISAFQGKEGLAAVQEALSAGAPFGVAFVDVRMPPGWDGVETVQRLWEADPRLQVVLCTAYSDYSWRELAKRLEVRDRLLILKKPFDPMEVSQLATTLTAKWHLSRQADQKMVTLEEGVAARTAELAAANAALRERTRQLTEANEALRVYIARRRAAEEAANNAQRRVADILEFLPDPTFVVDSEKRVIAWNRALVELTGVKKEEMLGRGDHAYAIPFYGAARMLLINVLDEEQEVQESSYPGLERKGETVCTQLNLVLGGRERLVWTAAAPLYDVQGDRVGGIQTIREITELRHYEQERSQLEARLQHANLLQSLVVKLNQDLRTPVTPLIAFLPVAREKTADPALKRMLEVCERSAEQIVRLTTDATDWVRSSTRAPSELAPVLLARIAQERLHKNAGLFSQLGVRYDCSEIDTGLTVLGAPDQLVLLFDNLLSNAAHHCKANGTVCIWALSAAGMVTVAVQDDGTGLIPDECEGLFHPAAERAGNDRSGLALCKRIVQNHAGSIWAESPGPGAGTTVFFTLKEARAGVSTTPLPAKGAKGATCGPAGQRRVEAAVGVTGALAG